MKLYTIMLICMVFVLLTGCSEDAQKSQDTHLFNSSLMDAYSNTSINNAIISQHTLYPYHFVNNSGQLNELGDNDLKVLIKHFMDNPGKLNIRRGQVSNEIYQARIDVILKQFRDAGVDRKKIAISDGMSGGEGMSSERVVDILENERRARR